MRIARMAWVPVVFLAVGCMEGRRVIKLNADGSGTIVDTVTLSEQMRGMLEGFAEMDKSSPAEKKAKKETKLKDRAAAMGPGASFVSYEPSIKNGPEKITYAFADINKLKVEPTPDSSENDSKEEGKESLSFRFEKKAGGSVLTVMGAGPKPDAQKSPATPESKEAAEAAAKMQAASMGMMKTMLKGLKMTTQVEVHGKLVKTSSPYVQGSTVTLLDLDFDQILADEVSFKKFTEAGDAKTMDPAKLKGIKGVKVQMDPVTTIEFK